MDMAEGMMYSDRLTAGRGVSQAGVSDEGYLAIIQALGRTMGDRTDSTPVFSMRSRRKQ
jgi:hypothetical protein